MKKRPAKFYSIYFAENDVNNLSDIEIMSHENSSNKTVKEINQITNSYSDKADARTAKRTIWNALKGRYSSVPECR